MGQSGQDVEQDGDIATHSSLQLKLKSLFPWASAILTAAGYTLFTLSNAAQISAHVQPSRHPQSDSLRLYDWIGCLCAWIGLVYLVFPGQVFKWFEMLNSDYDDRLEEWQKDKTSQREPLLRFFGFQPKKLPYWGATFRMLGAGFFAWASTADVINQTFRVAFTPYKQSWLIWFPYVLAPSCLLIGGTCLIWATSHSWTGFVPVSLQRMRTMTFWINLLAWIASWGILAGGISQWNKNHIMESVGGSLGQQLYRGICYFAFGSLCFLISQLVQIAQLVFKKD